MPGVARLGDLHMAVAYHDDAQHRTGIHQREQVVHLERKSRGQICQVDAVRMLGNHIQQTGKPARRGVGQRMLLDSLDGLGGLKV